MDSEKINYLKKVRAEMEEKMFQLGLGPFKIRIGEKVVLTSTLDKELNLEKVGLLFAEDEKMLNSIEMIKTIGELEKSIYNRRKLTFHVNYQNIANRFEVYYWTQGDDDQQESEQKKRYFEKIIYEEGFGNELDAIKMKEIFSSKEEVDLKIELINKVMKKNIEKINYFESQLRREIVSIFAQTLNDMAKITEVRVID